MTISLTRVSLTGVRQEYDKSMVGAGHKDGREVGQKHDGKQVLDEHHRQKVGG